MYFKASLASAALAATCATAFNSHRHRHVDRNRLAGHHARAGQGRDLVERDLIYAHTETKTITDVVYVTVTVGGSDAKNTKVAPTAAFFEPGSASAASAAPSVAGSRYGQNKGSSDGSEFEVDTTEVIEQVPPTIVSTEAVEEPTPAAVEETTPEVTVEQPTTDNVIENSTTAIIEEATPKVIAEPEPTTTVEAEPEATNSATASPPASVGSGSVSCKRGIAYNNPDITDQFTSSGNICWGYNWGSTGSLNDGALYIPMLWGNKFDFFDVWDTNVAAMKDANPDLGILFSFNEPDLESQAGETLSDPAVAAAAHIEKMGSYFNQGYRIGAPAVTSDFGNSARSWSWLANFMDACSSQNSGSCPVSFINTHYYELSGDCPIDGFKAYIEELASRFPGYPIWVTEVQATGCDSTNQARFIQEITEYAESNSNIEALSYFYGDGVLTDGVTINSLGRTYVDA